MNAVAILPAPTQPRTFYLVTYPSDPDHFYLPTAREHADAICTLKQIEYPGLGPWEVVELREVLP